MATKWKQLTDFDDEVSRYEIAGNYLYLLTQKKEPAIQRLTQMQPL